MARSPALLLDRFLREAAVDGERLTALLRLLLCALALVNIFGLAHGLEHLLAGWVKTWVQVGSIGVAAAVSAGALRVARSNTTRGLVEASVAADALIVLGVVGPSVWWPSPTYAAFLAMPATSGFAMAIVAAGFRLSYRAVAVSAALNMGFALGLLGFDRARNPVARAYPVDDHGAFVLLLVFALGVAIAIVRRTRLLVAEGSKRALEAERARQRLGVYVSREVAEVALAADELQMGGARRVVSVLFADLRGFTAYSERLPPERLVRELNAYLEAMLPAITAEGGVVDKFIGDAIMVVFGLPTARADDAARAIRAAAAMQRALAEHNEARAARGLPPLRQGIGVHHGEVVAGNVGTADRLQYTVIGDAVNLASRLESLTKELGVPVLISEDAAQAAGVELRLAGRVQVRGRDQDLAVFTLG